MSVLSVTVSVECDCECGVWSVECGVWSVECDSAVSGNPPFGSLFA